MSFLGAFDKSAGPRRQAKFNNLNARYKHEANRAKYNNKVAAFRANEDARVIGLSRSKSDAYRKLIIGARGKALKGQEQSYKAYAKGRRADEGGRSSRAKFSDFERLLQAQATIENQVSLASGEAYSIANLGANRQSIQIHNKHIGALGVPAQTPLMQPYAKENKFMTALNFVNTMAKTASTVATAGSNVHSFGSTMKWWE